MAELLRALLALCCLALLAVPACAAPLDRTRFAADLCGDGAAQVRAAEGLVQVGGDLPADDLTFAGGLLGALAERRLSCPADGTLLLDRPGAPEGHDALTGAVRPAPKARAPVLGLRQRAAVETARGIIALLTGPDPAARSAGLAVVERRIATVPAAVLDRARDTETDAALKATITGLAQAAALSSPDPARRRAAIAAVAASPSGTAQARLAALKGDPAYASDPAFRAALDAGLAQVSRAVAIGDGLAVVYNGLSFASILFMAAAGLAIIFGLMGVINLAQGEFIMLGAYATYGVQEAFRRFAPGLLDFYLVAAIPVAFGAVALVGIVVETLILRHLYRRPLMSLLATWAVSLFLVNLVRVTVGTQNLQFVMPAYVSGGVPLYADFVVTWNRLFAIAFAVATLVVTLLILRRTPLGLDIRAVTQNRDMAACLGLPTRRIDRLAFGLGSGLAGLAGVALCPIYSVNPGMGSGFIVDSFMVVVLGGVGSLVGTLVAALGVGGANVLIEPISGAVAAKVIVLVGIILFLQRRPEGLFAVRRRR
ncbi:amino acid/amide ABC transporter membrane protein 1, HAAT family [Methylobacterium phyllostachyos]|uniref:Amino acid/amide ABC transporter membrane protein 1, HAAT family n=1 Tax=Methylobacterium phyllostachyos TaxID=582672 RepID=A0A1H0I801_9HYPH|nr:urea ABC transporter permease subunit UrtB [Methylobacterium phyllostachyos]SDO27400.1 amino acid/amide ABC transporter membrane protein 1, HAAT family [Methylobacterium phyllostachyos]